MKRYGVTLLLAVALIGLGAYVYFVELPADVRKGRSQAEQKKILSLPEHEIDGLTVRLPTGDIVLARQDGRWRIVAPVQTDADTREVEGLLRALMVGHVSRVVEEQGTNLGPFGLAEPPAVLIVKTGTAQETLSLGDSGPISSTLYAMRDSDKKVLLTDLSAKDFLNKSLLTFRKKEILTFDPGKTDRVRLTYPTTEIVLYRMEGKSGKKEWMIRFPVETPADQPEARSLMIKLEDLKALGFIDPGREHVATSKRLTKPDLKVTVHTGDTDQTVKLFKGGPTSGEAFAVTTPDAPIYRINPNAIKDLTKDLFVLQDKRLLGLDRDELARVTVKTRDRNYTLVNQNDQWALEDRLTEKVDPQKADLFISRVADLPAELRVVKQAGQLTAYGLASPSLEVTAQAKDGRIGRLVLGTKVGGLVYAMGQRLSGVYQARADLLDQVPSAAELLAKSKSR